MTGGGLSAYVEKTLLLALNNVPTIPHALRTSPVQNVYHPEITINLANLYHHYYLDSYGRIPPNPDPTQFEYLQFILPTRAFRLRGDGLGVSTVMRRHGSTSLGQAFCRMLLHDHFGIVYFAHMERVLNRQLIRAFSSMQVTRQIAGDAPDYFCAQNTSNVFLAEAKGRYTAINFSNREFQSWRNQFNRVAIRNSEGSLRSVKGYIVATRFATEERPLVRSGIFAEDPHSPGEEALTEDQTSELSNTVIALHYSELVVKLGQPLLSSALSGGYLLSEEIRIIGIVWTLRVGPNQGMRFVGGFYQGTSAASPFIFKEGKLVYNPVSSFSLDRGTATFVGIEESIFKEVVSFARVRQPLVERGIAPFVGEILPIYSGLSLLRDGSVIGPIDFFAPVGQIDL
jgi:hypothetical protein